MVGEKKKRGESRGPKTTMRRGLRSSDTPSADALPKRSPPRDSAQRKISSRLRLPKALIKPVSAFRYDSIWPHASKTASKTDDVGLSLAVNCDLPREARASLRARARH